MDNSVHTALSITLSTALNIPVEQLDIKNEQDFVNGLARHLFIVTPTSFIKGAKDPHQILLLKHEAAATDIVDRIGIPTRSVKRIIPGVDGEILLVEFVALDMERGLILEHNEDVVGLDQRFGKIYAEVVLGLIGREIPQAISVASMAKPNWKNVFPTFIEEFERRATNVRNFLVEGRARGIELTEKELDSYLQYFSVVLMPRIQSDESLNKKYFVHNDLGPNQIYFRDQENPDQGVLLLDFEYSTAVTNQLLGKITDLGNFYSRLWSNPTLQRDFVWNCLRAPRAGRTEQERLLAGAMIFSTVALSNYGLDPHHPEYATVIALLNALPTNMKLVSI